MSYKVTRFEADFKPGEDKPDRKPFSRVDLQKVLTDPVLKKKLFVQTIIATQAREGVETTVEQAEAAYDKIQRELDITR